MGAMRALQLTPTGELDRLASNYSLASRSPHLSDLERSAILAGIYSELAERDALHKSVFRFATERERLQTVIESQESQIFGLECQVRALEDLLKQENKEDGKVKSRT
jgi:hypothetical protein